MRSLIGIALIFAVAREARADVQILKPDQPVAGQTQLFWAQAWWQWILSIPAATNPGNDQTGAFAATGNNGPVFFLAGTFGGAASRTIVVPSGKPVFFPVVHQFFAAIGANGNFDPSPCKTPLTQSCAVDQVTSVINKATNMTVQIDDKIITTTTNPKNMFRETSTSFFVVTLPDNNVLGLPAGTYFPGNPVWVEDGYYIMLSNLSPGTHSLHWHAEIPTIMFFVDVTDTLNVAP
jgi:hypothetical protein